MKYKPFQCPYEQISCPFVDTATSTLDQDCTTCAHYHNGVRATGGMPVLGSFCEKIAKVVMSLFV